MISKKKAKFESIKQCLHEQTVIIMQIVATYTRVYKNLIKDEFVLIYSSFSFYFFVIDDGDDELLFSFIFRLFSQKEGCKP